MERAKVIRGETGNREKSGNASKKSYCFFSERIINNPGKQTPKNLS